jgi:hypothetical protein
VKGSYAFLAELRRLEAALKQYESLIWALNASIIAIFIYAAALLLGLPAFTSFNWPENPALAQSPALLSLALGVAAATLLKRRRRPDIFRLLGPEISEKARAGYDNRDADSIFMDSLAEELRRALSAMDSSAVLNWRDLKVRAAVGVILAGLTVFIAQSQISADLSPADLQPLSELRDRALGLFQNETHPQKVNLSGSIYGKPSLAVLNEEKIELQLYPGIGTGSRARPSKPEEHLFQQAQAGEAVAVPSELYIESLPPQNREIIKRYFEALAKG